MTTAQNISSHLLRSRISKICVAITGSTPQEMVENTAGVLQDTTFLEFRLDYLPDPAAAVPVLREFLAANGAVTAIATCRCKENGGRFEGKSTDALDILLKAAGAGFQVVDLELESVEKLPKDTLQHLRDAGAAIIVSYHDFKATKDLDAVYKRIEPFAPDFVKIVPTARSLSDNLTLLKFLERVQDTANGNVVGICMGEPGIISRVLGLRSGSAFTFAAATAGEETAPGQIAARTLMETYRLEQVDKATKVYGVAGDPIRSSLSPIMLNAAFRRETVNSVYLSLQASKADDLFRLAREIPLQGLSITMPLKEQVIPFLERTDPLSTKIGAVNTISRMPDGKFYGFNTDVAGIVVPIERRMPLRGAKVLVLGAGGAARAAVFGCRDKGAEVFICNRTLETAQKLAKESGAKCIKRDALAKSTFDIVINSTPVGMAGNKTPSLLESAELNARLVFDLVYNPMETPLLRLARQKGIAVISGVEMFVQQGARQFEIWTGKPAPEDDMLKVVLHALRANSESGELPASPAAPPPASAAKAQDGTAPKLAPAPPSAKNSSTDPEPAAHKRVSAPAKASEKEAPGKPAAPSQSTQPVKAAAKKAASVQTRSSAKKAPPPPVKSPAKKAAAKKSH